MTRVDSAGLDTDGLREVIADETAAAQARLSPESGVMAQVVWFDAGPGHSGRLLVMVHRLAVDSVSWQILLPDLATAWRPEIRGKHPQLKPVPTALRTWSASLNGAAAEPSRAAELPLWRRILDTSEPLLAHRALDPAYDTFATVQSLSLTLPTEVTQSLLTEVPAGFHARVSDVVLTGLALAVERWRERRGLPNNSGVLVDLAGQGRETTVPGVDPSRTVGWFTSTFPYVCTCRKVAIPHREAH